ncbi:MAG TPA: cation:dicarboxylase symporter family transporter [Holophagaceae bacterium]|nr:cation:dicarboxylase symporter family transporter [Holophagaceae bacterium]
MAARKPWWRSGTAWIFGGLLLGIALGGSLPRDTHPFAYQLFHFLAAAFIALIKSLIVPLIFSTLVVGIAKTGDLKAVGRMGMKALLYFELVTTFALVIGLVVANVVKPGAGMHLDLAAHGAAPAAVKSGWDTLLHLFPSNVVQSAAEGDILPVVIFATLFAMALVRVPGGKGEPVLRFFDSFSQVMFKYTDMVMLLTPLGVFGAMAASMSGMAAGQLVNGELLKGWPAVLHLLKQYALLVGSLYGALALLVLLVFIPVMKLCRIKVLDYFRAVREPATIAFSTASSEAALPRLLEQTVKFGVPERVAGFVIPAGYSFNLDGSTLYLVLAGLTIAQAAGVHMGLWQQVAMLLTFMLTSKGVAGVPRGTLVIIAGTCGSFGLPGEAGIAMLLAVDAIMDMARTLTNVLGNGLASIVVAKWEGVFGREQSL